MIYLLDLNYTLVSNSSVKIKPFTEQIFQEQYRTDLLEKLAGYKVLLLTARPAVHREQTLLSIEAKTGWKPDQAYFNSYGVAPPIAKDRMLRDFVFPSFGSDGSLFFSIESNPQTRAMYAKYGIKSCSYAEFMER